LSGLRGGHAGLPTGRHPLPHWDRERWSVQHPRRALSSSPLGWPALWSRHRKSESDAFSGWFGPSCRALKCQSPWPQKN